MPEPELVTPELLRDWPLPAPGGSKKSRGQVVVVGGAARTPGGVVLSGLAALRVGAGHLQLALAALRRPRRGCDLPRGRRAGSAETAAEPSRAAAADACAEMVAGSRRRAGRTRARRPRRGARPPGGRCSPTWATARRWSWTPSPSECSPRCRRLSALGGTSGADPERRGARHVSSNATASRTCDDLRQAAERYSCCVTAQGMVADARGPRLAGPPGPPGPGHRRQR